MFVATPALGGTEARAADPQSAKLPSIAIGYARVWSEVGPRSGSRRRTTLSSGITYSFHRFTDVSRRNRAEPRPFVKPLPFVRPLREPFVPPRRAAPGLAGEPVRHPPPSRLGGGRGRARRDHAVRGPPLLRGPGLGLDPHLLADLVLDCGLPQGIELLREADLLDEAGPAVRALVRVDGDGALAQRTGHRVPRAGLRILPHRDVLRLAAALLGAADVPEPGGQLRA